MVTTGEHFTRNKREEKREKKKKHDKTNFAGVTLIWGDPFQQQHNLVSIQTLFRNVFLFVTFLENCFDNVSITL